ncbi:NADPH-flavin oxidoreductase [subsurface metagenome]
MIKAVHQIETETASTECKEITMEVMEAIKTRRSIRKYKATPVDDKNVELVLEAARWAPSWANTQCWRFIVVRDSSIKSELADTLTSRNPSTEAVRHAPVVIVACAELGKSGYYKGGPATDKGDWFMFDVALAMQNLALAAHSLGLGTVHVGLFDAKRAAAILGVPQNFNVVEMTPLGYPDQEPTAPPRKELSEIVFYDRYGIKISG